MQSSCGKAKAGGTCQKAQTWACCRPCGGKLCIGQHPQRKNTTQVRLFNADREAERTRTCVLSTRTTACALYIKRKAQADLWHAKHRPNVILEKTLFTRTPGHGTPSNVTPNEIPNVSAGRELLPSVHTAVAPKLSSLLLPSSLADAVRVVTSGFRPGIRAGPTVR